MVVGFQTVCTNYIYSQCISLFMNYLEVLEARHQAMVEKDAKAKAEGTMVGRYITEPCADSCAYYEIVAVKKNAVTIRHLDIWDGWTIPYWGKETDIRREYAEDKLAHRDRLNDFLSRK